MEQTIQTQVLIIGGGATGCGLARDLSLRGLSCVLAEKSDINAGASGANHGLLHSGARYAASDKTAAAECAQEGALLKKTASHCINDTGGLFVAVPGDDDNYIADFPGHCEKAGVACKEIDPKQALEMEPSLHPDLIAAFEVPDAHLDPFMLSLENIAHAQELGASLIRHSRAVQMEMDKGRVKTVILEDLRTGKKIRVEAEVVVNAAGAWAGQVCQLAGVQLDVVCSKGSLLVTYGRVAQRVVNRLRPSSDGDILVPGGTVSLLGTTSITVDSPEGVRPTVPEADSIVKLSAEMVPSLATTRYIRSYAGVRPLISEPTEADGRSLSRGIFLTNHANQGAENLVTISGGKLTTFRLMAEQAADMVCELMGVDEPCRTRTEPLPHTQAGQWTEPGMAPRWWVKEGISEDFFLCECEMVPKSAVDKIVGHLCEKGCEPDLPAISLRSRVGKGGCQGAFCGARVATYLADKGHMTGPGAVEELRQFFSKRWKGVRPICWDTAMVQEQLADALYCGLFHLELSGEGVKEAGHE